MQTVRLASPASFMFLLGLLSALCLCVQCRVQPTEIRSRPIDFGNQRQTLTRAYAREHYGEGVDPFALTPRVVVVHWTAVPTLEGSFARFKGEKLPSDRASISHAGALNVSAHFLVARDGRIYRLMPETHMARHCIGLNHVAIGIENVGGPEHPLTEAQLSANAQLVRYLNKKHPTLSHLIGHYEYRSFETHPLFLERDPDYRTEKHDPGPRFMKDLRHRLRGLRLKGPP